ncbi:MAG: oxidoreductase [Burkholderiales bacterium]|nr:oxidoreductase [Burkholderiales bacterium]
MFRALVLENDGGFRATVKSVDAAQLPAADVTLAVSYATLNYKDGLAITNRGPVVRQWPMVAGVDGAGTVVASNHPDWQVGDLAVHNGWGAGETHWGCLAETARLKGDWLIRLPQALSLRQSMAIGTAGYTAMLCVLALEDHGLKPDAGEVLVTGASGGVGSVAIALLGRLGYTVVAATGRASEETYLKALGASSVMDRDMLASPGKALQKERWAGVVDAVGSHTLANALAQTRYGGVVAACGLAQGMDLASTVMPFILRGVALVGIDSVMAPLSRRQRAWARIARDLDPVLLETMVQELPLDGAIDAAHALMDGRVRGRTLVKIGS